MAITGELWRGIALRGKANFRRLKGYLKPYLRGRDIKRYHIASEDLWIIFTRRGLDIKKYPAIHKHMKHFQAGLTPGIKGGRKPGAYQWFDIQDNVAYWNEFDVRKVTVPSLTNKPNFAEDTGGHYTNNKACILIPPSIPLALSVCNSSICEWLMRQSFPSKQGGFYEFLPTFIRQIPIPAAPPAEQAALEKLVRQIVAAKAADPAADVTAAEAAINARVYKLFRLTREEIAVIEGA